MLTALTFALILTSAVVVHELAHYLTARSVAVPVRAFSVGIGPVLLRRRWRGTEWRLSLLPLGGYVDPVGMAPTVGEDGKLHHPTEGMATKSLGAKLWVLVAGVVANYLLGSVLLASAIVMQPAYREITTGAAVVVEGSSIAEVTSGSAAASLGLLAGDRFLSINGVADPSPDQVVAQVQGASELELVILRGGQELTFTTPWPPAGAPSPPLLGVRIAPLIESPSFATALGESLRFGVRVVPDMVRGFVSGFAGAVTGAGQGEIAGPVGIVSMVDQARRVGIAPVILLAAVINFSLAVFNLLPIPGLDGGRMLLATVVAIRRRPFAPGQEEQFHFFGVMAVLALLVLITFRELSGLFAG